MTLEQKVVLDLIGQTLFGVPFNPDNYANENINWEAVYAESQKQTVVPTVVEAIPAEVDRDLRLRWINDAYTHEKRGYEVLKAHSFVSKLLKDKDIPFITIKGASSGSYYPKHYQRKYGDVDLLTTPEHYENVKRILVDNDFNIGKELPFEVSLRKDGICYDLHQEISGIPDGECGNCTNTVMADIIESSIECQAMDCKIPVPDDFHHGMIQLLHTSKHLVGFGAGLRQLCDWAVFVNHMGENFPSVFEERLKQCGLWKLANTMSAACVKHMHMPSYSWIDCSGTDLIDRFLEDLMRKGSLVHDGNDDMDSVFVAETNKGGVSNRNMFTQMLSNIAGKVCYQWPIMEKHKALIPFGIFWMSVRYCIGVIKGDYKKISLKSTVNKANERKSLYNDLGLFSEVQNADK